VPRKMIRNAVMRTAKGKLRAGERKKSSDQCWTAMRKMPAGTLAGVWSALISRAFGFDLNLHDFSERHHEFLFSRALDDLHMHFIGGDARDALDYE